MRDYTHVCHVVCSIYHTHHPILSFTKLSCIPRTSLWLQWVLKYKLLHRRICLAVTSVGNLLVRYLLICLSYEPFFWKLCFASIFQSTNIMLVTNIFLKFFFNISWRLSQPVTGHIHKQKLHDCGCGSFPCCTLGYLINSNLRLLSEYTPAPRTRQLSRLFSFCAFLQRHVSSFHFISVQWCNELSQMYALHSPGVIPND
jgi:hypothetical protein